MRITGFDVDGFGLLHDQSVDGVAVGTTVVLGPNEAGKSTLHAFLVRTLFGHPRRNDAAGRNRHEPLKGGRHGGVVHCQDDTGRWEVHRYTTGSPRLRVIAPDDGEATGSDALLPLLGRTVDAQRYEQVFAIDLDDLAGVGSLGGGALDDLLFDAATVGTGRSLRAARAEAAERRDELWTPTSTTRPLAAALQRRTEARAALAEAQDAARGNLDVRRRLDAAALRVEDLAEQQQAAAAQVTLLERVRDAWPAHVRAEELRQRSQALPDVTVDGEAVAAVRAAASDHAEAEQQVAELDDRRGRLAHEADGIDVDEQVRGQADRIEDLVDRLGAHELRLEQLAAAERTRDTHRKDLDAALADLGARWGIDALDRVAADATTRQRVAVAGDELLEARRRAEEAAERAEHAQRTAARRRDAVTGRIEAVPEAPGEDEVARAEQAVSVLRTALPSLVATPSTSARGGSLPAGVLTALVGVVLGLGLALLGLPAWLVAVVVAVGVGAGAYLIGRARTHVGAGPTGRVAASEDVATATRMLGLARRPSLTDVERVATDVARDRQRRRDVADAQRQVDGLRAEAHDAERSATQLVAVAEERADAAAAAGAGWRDACTAAGLDTTDPVRVTTTRHDRIAEALAARRALEAAADEVAELRRDVGGYRDEARTVTTALGHTETGTAAVRLLPGLRDAARAAVEAAARRDRRRDDQAAVAEQLATARDAVHSAEEQLQAALAATTADDLAELEQQVDVAEQRERVADQLAAAERQVTQLLGSGPRGEEGRELLAQADPAAWEQLLEVATTSAADRGADRDRALEERTELAGELERLGGDDAVPLAAQQLAAAETEVAELAERWAVADTATKLLEETVARFEREQQPRVLERASQLLQRATAGQWAQVRRLDGQVVVARAEGGEPVSASVLSRGTREQLWLCLRLALAEDLATDRPLPLLVDDLLGTSDPERSLHVARVLAEVARRQQVWLFTCDPRTADLVTGTDPTAGVLRLRRGGRVVGLTRRGVTEADGDDVSPRLDL